MRYIPVVKCGKNECPFFEEMYKTSMYKTSFDYCKLLGDYIDKLENELFPEKCKLLKKYLTKINN